MTNVSTRVDRQTPLPPISRHIRNASPLVGLQLRAYRTLRRQVFRTLTRLAVLAAGDTLAFLFLRYAIGLVRDRAVLGGPVAGLVGGVLPLGYLGGWRFGVALFLGLLVAGAYGQDDPRRNTTRLLLGVALATAVSVWSNLWLLGPAPVALQFSLTTTAVWMALAMVRKGIERVDTRYRQRSERAERALFVGDPEDADARRTHDRLVRQGRVQSLGWVTNGKVKSGPLHMAAPEDIWFILQQTQADTVVLAGQFPDQLAHSVVEAAAAAGCRTLFVPRFDSVGHLRSGIVQRHGVAFVDLRVPALTARHFILKRCFDVVGAALGLIILAPVFLLIGVAIALDSPGPILFTQKRAGLGGRLFKVLKFRTMRDGADAQKQSLQHLNHTGDPRLFKIPDDPRVTRLGAWLRRWSLDELPQLVNVLLGSMSLVGPRPFPDEDLAGYEDHHFLRLSVKPGITGLWQVKGRSDVVDFEEVVRYDREYIESWSFWLDLKIMVQTIPAVLSRTGAY